MLDRLYAMVMRIGAEIKVLSKRLTVSLIHVSINTTELAIGQKDAENIRIF